MKDYENLALNVAELKRFLNQQTDIIVYYEEAVVRRKKMAKISDSTEVALPLRNMISLIAAASIATWAYFGIVERINNLETSTTMMKSDLNFNTEFRIKWPRGEMGSLTSRL